MKKHFLLKFAFALMLLIASTNTNAQISIGGKAPELAFPSPKGDTIKLSSLKGNVVLIDFWATWCGPCRRALPALVNLYNKYQGKKWIKGTKGFTVYSYSLDQNKTAWENGIASMGLIWPYHTSDLAGWGAKGAAAYGVRGIPMTVLIDETGTILAVNASDAIIEEQLNKRLAPLTPAKTTKKKTTTKTTKPKTTK